MRHLAVCVFTVVMVANAQADPARTAAWDVYFSPRGGAQEAVVRELNLAKKTVYVQAYSFTNAPIAKALVEASKRGVAVELVLDKSNATARYSAATFTRNAGLPTAIDAAHAIAHDKVMIIDERTVITGSYNFTSAAEHNNAENLLVLRDFELARRYLANWRKHRAHAKPS